MQIIDSLSYCQLERILFNLTFHVACCSLYAKIATCGQSGMKMWKFRFVPVHGIGTQLSPKWPSRSWQRERFFTSEAIGKLL